MQQADIIRLFSPNLKCVLWRSEELQSNCLECLGWIEATSYLTVIYYHKKENIHLSLVCSARKLLSTCISWHMRWADLWWRALFHGLLQSSSTLKKVLWLWIFFPPAPSHWVPSSIRGWWVLEDVLKLYFLCWAVCTACDLRVRLIAVSFTVCSADIFQMTVSRAVGCHGSLHWLSVAFPIFLVWRLHLSQAAISLAINSYRLADWLIFLCYIT